MKYYAAFLNNKGERQAMLFESCSFDRYFAATFSPYSKEVFLFRLTAEGKTYKERKNNIRKKAEMFYGHWFPLSSKEWLTVNRWFKDQAGRYGLETELRKKNYI